MGHVDNGPLSGLGRGATPEWHIFPAGARLTRLYKTDRCSMRWHIQAVVFSFEGEQHAIVALSCRAQAEQLIREGFAWPRGLPASGPGWPTMAMRPVSFWLSTSLDASQNLSCEFPHGHFRRPAGLPRSGQGAFLLRSSSGPFIGTPRVVFTADNYDSVNLPVSAKSVGYDVAWALAEAFPLPG